MPIQGSHFVIFLMCLQAKLSENTSESVTGKKWRLKGNEDRIIWNLKEGRSEIRKKQEKGVEIRYMKRQQGAKQRPLSPTSANP